ncbi:hypothetical protein BgiMline_018131, partial [Biomphalaria glabrata]
FFTAWQGVEGLQGCDVESGRAERWLRKFRATLHVLQNFTITTSPGDGNLLPSSLVVKL